MKLLTTRRSDFDKVNELLPLISFTGDSHKIYWNITDKQYKYFKHLLPDHAIFTLPKSMPGKEPKSILVPSKP